MGHAGLPGIGDLTGICDAPVGQPLHSLDEMDQVLNLACPPILGVFFPKCAFRPQNEKAIMLRIHTDFLGNSLSIQFIVVSASE